ncbi:MAG TPA: hypothetical protein VKK61_02360 [Tepidisphaeraceae bacterium]|nr:hypothetical protein [Tepidisphaeraceae bacterium]
MRLATVLIGTICSGALIGCRDNSPPPERVPVPASADNTAIYHREEMKPLPPPRTADTVPPPPFDDVPLVNQQPPEEPAFVDAYRRVGSPRIVLFINRTLEGNVIPVNANEPLVSVEQSRTSSSGKTDYKKSTDVYLHPGQYDEAAAKDLDYEAIENIMTDWLAANGQVTIISPIMARQRLTDEQVKEIQEGRPQAMSEAVRLLGAEIFVQVQAHPTQQTAQGLEVRIIAEAINVKGGESIARAVVDVPPPLEKTTINKYTRFLARKLMDGMIGSWLAPPPPPAQIEPPPAPQTPPPPPAPSRTPPTTAPSGTTTFLP